MVFKEKPHTTIGQTAEKICLHSTRETGETTKDMVSVVMLIGGALANALAFTSSSYSFHRLFVNSIDAKKARHDAVIEQLQQVQIEWAHKRQQRIDFINKQLRLEEKA